MSYEVGQVVPLWETRIEPGRIVVLREILVKITETKTGVPGEFSEKPVSATSLRGVGDDGKKYEKHWSVWPESQANDFKDQWSHREDGTDDSTVGGQLWIPLEAVPIYSSVTRHNMRHHGKPDKQIDLVGADGSPIKPEGDVVYCKGHDQYYYPGQKCFRCLLAEIRKEKQAA
jgi:hypothetical protein